MQRVDPGLAGVVVADTALSHVDGAAGELVLRGRRLADLAGARFEDVCALLWEEEPQAVRAHLARGREAAFALLPTLGDALDRSDGMDALRASLGHLSAEHDPVGAAAVFVAAWSRRRRGLTPSAPSPARAHAEDFLHMVHGEADPARVDALDTYLVTVADHGLNASTFAARVVTSTRSDTVSAVVAAVCALKGPLHGGAPGPVLDMLDAIASPDRARSWLEGELSAGRRIMGMGHRVYRTRDPRAAVLEQAAHRLAAAGVATERLALAGAVEHEAHALLRARHPARPLHANVEFYTAVLLEAVGLPRWMFASTFAVARCAGWLAHVREQRALDRLIRPASRYVGPLPDNEV